jgi:hypothetical protein
MSVNNRDAVQWAIRMGLAKPPTPPTVTVASMKRRHATAAKKAAERPAQDLSLPVPTSPTNLRGDAEGVGNLTQSDHRTGRDFIYTKPPKIPYRRPGGTYGEPTGRIYG